MTCSGSSSWVKAGQGTAREAGVPGDGATQARLWDRGGEGRTENLCRKAGAVYEDTDPKCEECGAGTGAQPGWSRCEWHEETGGQARLGAEKVPKVFGLCPKGNVQSVLRGYGGHT